MTLIEIIGFGIVLVGFIVGLGAVTVIDFHGFLARRSEYWTEATIRTHKITKPLIWIGILLAISGGMLMYSTTGWHIFSLIHGVLAVILILNGLFLSFRVSPFLLDREKNGNAATLLPDLWQRRILASFIVSFVCWWSSVVTLCWYVYTLMSVASFLG